MKRDLAELRSLIAPGRSATYIAVANKVSQLVLLNQYREQVLRKEPLPTFEDVEFRAFSQNSEDGILLYVFGLIGMGRRRCVEICAGDGIECNTANLIVNHGWSGLLFDGNEELLQRGRAFYSQLGDTFCYPPKLVNSWITRENINDLIKENGFEGPVDLLSLDLDGVDYWIWEAIEVIRPRVVIEPENFLTFLRGSGSERSPYTNFPMESGPMRLFSRRCLASESGLCLSSLYLIPG